MRRNRLSRRTFLKTAGVAAAAPYVITSAALGAEGRPAASERITMGAIGLGGRGNSDLGSLLGNDDVQMLAVCDVQRGKRNAGKAKVDFGSYLNLVNTSESIFNRIFNRGDVFLGVFKIIESRVHRGSFTTTGRSGYYYDAMWLFYYIFKFIKEIRLKTQSVEIMVNGLFIKNSHRYLFTVDSWKGAYSYINVAVRSFYLKTSVLRQPAFGNVHI